MRQVVSAFFVHERGYHLRLCGIFRDGARRGIIEENKLHSPGDPLLKTNPILATEFLILPADMG